MTLLSDQVSTTEINIILRELAKTTSVVGDVVEFGCYVGTTSVFLAKEIAKINCKNSDNSAVADYLKSYHKRLFLYDSFEGLPEKSAEDQSPAGIQFKRGELLATKKQLITNLKRADITPLPIIKKAWFTDLTPRDIPERISFAFLDGDYYYSILDPLKLIWPRLSDGAIVIVDDYASEALPGAARAVCDWQQKHQFNVQIEASLGIIRKNN